jgi:hypothetical protein
MALVAVVLAGLAVLISSMLAPAGVAHHMPVTYEVLAATPVEVATPVVDTVRPEPGHEGHEHGRKSVPETPTRHHPPTV